MSASAAALDVLLKLSNDKPSRATIVTGKFDHFDVALLDDKLTRTVASSLLLSVVSNAAAKHCNLVAVVVWVVQVVDDVEVVDVVVPELVFVVELSVVVGVVVFVGVGVAADAVSDELELLHATKIQERPIPIKLVIAKLSVDVDRRILFSPKNEISLSREYVTQSCQVYVVLLQSKINTFIFD
jgi:hypothetical protein